MAFKWRVIQSGGSGASIFLADAEAVKRGDVEFQSVSTASRADRIFTWDDALNPQPNSPLGRFVTRMRELGFNGLALEDDPDKHQQELRSFARYLKQNGIALIVRRDWCETEIGYSIPITRSFARPRTSSKLCPYDDEVRDYWEKRVARDFEMMPDLGGYRTTGTEFYFINGTPWMCDCGECRQRTGRERTRDAIRLMAGLVGQHGGTLFWETCQDDPWGQRQEAYYFRDFTGEIPDNALVVLKRLYFDYHPYFPRHPLYDTIAVNDHGQSPYMTSVPIPNEWMGVHRLPWCNVDEWGGAFQDMVTTGQQGVWVFDIVERGSWDPPLNRVNWYSMARYMRDPHADPEEIKLTWATEEFGEKVAPQVVGVLDKATDAVRGMYYFDGLWTVHQSALSNLEYMDSHMCGPYRQSKRMAGMMGLAWPLDMYAPSRAEEIRADPRTRLAFNQVPITPKLKAEAMVQKDEAVRLMGESVALWRSLEGKMDAGPHRTTLAGLEGHLDDALILRHAMDLYMDWKLGVLTETKIDAVLEACQGLRGILVPEPLTEEPKGRGEGASNPASLKTLAEQLRQDLREPWVEAYWHEHATGEGAAPRKEHLSDPRRRVITPPAI